MKINIFSSKSQKIMFIISGILFFLTVSFFAFVWFSTYHPEPVENIDIQGTENAPRLKNGSELKIMSWNIQYLAGKNYVFFYDLLDGSGPDTRPSSKDIAHTLSEVVRIIKDENPDIILLQEVDDGAKRTDYEDQLSAILKKLPASYKNHVSAWYWKAYFVPHPKIMGKVGMKLAIISKYKLENAKRYALPMIPDCWIMKQFNLKRAVLVADLPFENQNIKPLKIAVTHLDAFAQGTDTMQKQVSFIKSMLDKYEQAGDNWLIGGDFNLLPPDRKSYERLGENQKKYFLPDSEIKLLTDKYSSVPSVSETSGNDYAAWFTHFPNDPEVKKPDRTIDYIFYSSGLKLKKHYVRQKDTLKISDHCPIISYFKVP